MRHRKQRRQIHFSPDEALQALYAFDPRRFERLREPGEDIIKVEILVTSLGFTVERR